MVLVNAHHVKNVPGRKTDVVNCQWFQELHSVGLLRGSFRPTAAIAALRVYLRHRETLVQSAATHAQRMQKALVQMNLQLPTVISDITGVTGLRILRDIVAAQHRQQVIRRLRQRAANIGLALVDRSTGEVLEGAVSGNLVFLQKIQSSADIF